MSNFSFHKYVSTPSATKADPALNSNQPCSQQNVRNISRFVYRFIDILYRNK